MVLHQPPPPPSPLQPHSATCSISGIGTTEHVSWREFIHPALPPKWDLGADKTGHDTAKRCVSMHVAVKTNVPHSSGGGVPRNRDHEPIARPNPVLVVGPTCLPTTPLRTQVTSEEPLQRHGRKQRVLSCLSCPACCFRLLLDPCDRSPADPGLQGMTLPHLHPLGL